VCFCYLCSLVRKNTRENSRKPCKGALKVTLGSLARSKTLRRCTQSHFGLTRVVKNTEKTQENHAQGDPKSFGVLLRVQKHRPGALKAPLWAHTGSHFAYKYGYILHGTLKNTGVFSYLGIWDHYFCGLVPMISCVGLCFAQLRIYSVWGPQNTRVFSSLVCIRGNCFVCWVWLCSQICIYSTWDPQKHLCFQYFCVMVYTCSSAGPCSAHKYANILHGTREQFAVSMLSIFMGEFKLKSYVQYFC